MYIILKKGINFCWMGLTQSLRNFYNLFPDCFSSELPGDKEFNIVIKEVLTDMVPTIFGITSNSNTTILVLLNYGIHFHYYIIQIKVKGICNTQSVNLFCVTFSHVSVFPGKKNFAKIFENF